MFYLKVSRVFFQLAIAPIGFMLDSLQLAEQNRNVRNHMKIFCVCVLNLAYSFVFNVDRISITFNF